MKRKNEKATTTTTVKKTEGTTGFLSSIFDIESGTDTEVTTTTTTTEPGTIVSEDIEKPGAEVSTIPGSGGGGTDPVKPNTPTFSTAKSGADSKFTNRAKRHKSAFIRI